MTFNWDNAKNLVLKKERGISFEEIVIAIEAGNTVDVLEHPNKNRYPDQILILVNVRDYIYVVPAIADSNGFFMKTIFPSRKFTNQYLRKPG
jgi:uncharacterized DUF497 family protein